MAVERAQLWGGHKKATLMQACLRALSPRRSDAHCAVLDAAKARLLGMVARAPPERLLPLLDATFEYISAPPLDLFHSSTCSQRTSSRSLRMHAGIPMPARHLIQPHRRHVM